MLPLRPCEYAFVNQAHWNRGLPTIARRPFVKPSFLTFVLAHLRAADTVAMPALCRLA